MKCPYCSYEETKVVDTRLINNGEMIRRRRECIECKKRFTTHEIIETVPIIVVKNDLSREPFNRNKLLSGMMRACEKRPVSIETIESITDRIENNIQNSMSREVSSKRIGELAMEALKEIDDVSYVRFASVYRKFTDINSFLTELTELLKEK